MARFTGRGVVRGVVDVRVMDGVVTMRCDDEAKPESWWSVTLEVEELERLLAEAKAAESDE